jgi:hypothetical protein
MAGSPHEPITRVQGPEATLTIAGIAIGLVVGMLRPGWAIGSAVAGVVLIVVGVLVKQRVVKLAGRLGLGLAVGAGLLYVLAAMNLLHPVGS